MSATTQEGAKPLWRIVRREKRPGERIGRLFDVAQVRGDIPTTRRTVQEWNEMTAADSLFGRSLRIVHFAYPVNCAVSR